MNDNTPVIRGYRTLGDPAKPDRMLSTAYLQQTSRASKLLRELWHRAPIEGAPCVGKAEQWTSDDLPTDREAQMMCGQCDIVELCRQYAEEAHPAWGVYGGRVFGRNLKERMDEDERREMGGSPRV